MFQFKRVVIAFAGAVVLAGLAGCQTDDDRAQSQAAFKGTSEIYAEWRVRGAIYVRDERVNPPICSRFTAPIGASVNGDATEIPVDCAGTYNNPNITVKVVKKSNSVIN